MRVVLITNQSIISDHPKFNMGQIPYLWATIYIYILINFLTFWTKRQVINCQIAVNRALAEGANKCIMCYSTLFYMRNAVPNKIDVYTLKGLFGHPVHLENVNVKVLAFYIIRYSVIFFFRDKNPITVNMFSHQKP